MASILNGIRTVGRAIRKLREVGVRYWMLLAIQRIVPARLFSVNHLVVLCLPTDRATDADAVSGRWARECDVETLIQFGHSRHELDRRLVRGDRAWALIEADRLVGYCWFTTHDYLDVGSGLVFPSPKDGVWLYDAMVDREHRGRGIYPRILSGAARQLASEGTRSIWIIVDSLNRNSIRAHEAAGARIRFRAGVWTLFGHRWEHRPSADGSGDP